MASQVPVGGAAPVTKVKVPEPKPFCGVRDAKALENFIFDLEQYFKATNTVTDRAKVTLATMYLCEDAKLHSRYVEKDKVFCFIEGLKPWAKTKLYEERVQDLMSAYAAVERLFNLTSDSQDVRRHQSSSLGRNKNSRLSSPKDAGGGKDSGRDCRPYNQTQRTLGEGRIIEAHPSVPSVVSCAIGHIWQENVRIKSTSMRFRPH
ncbi:senescence-specific cysteine protease sag39 [Cucumis melo var. makuwa]|uniref:Senescence-specific cysteine protease sag39 n=1 Tax=Cucumis melo var. makuwa TaxID=1194695 RepID=A0A5D3C9L0_CUCMM|nr:senescence-specific cysteine protease sag39 [Cucumis melo var. makuwa]TYK08657.1 senescence-specific cysteine protease sag39 [Cucumis melo var. makuwa]